MRENYKAQGTIVRSKEKLIIDEEQPTKFLPARTTKTSKKNN